jgi:hypothetical protein
MHVLYSLYISKTEVIQNEYFFILHKKSVVKETTLNQEPFLLQCGPWAVRFTVYK